MFQESSVPKLDKLIFSACRKSQSQMETQDRRKNATSYQR